MRMAEYIMRNLFVFLILLGLSRPAYGAETAAGAAGPAGGEPTKELICLQPEWEYASFSQINSGASVLYKPADFNGIVVGVNAGHGTSGGGSAQTLSHPDGTPKVTGGTNAEGAVYSMSISTGMEFPNGYPEAAATLSLAVILRDILLNKGYGVLMLRDSEDVQLDNIARAVIANNNADCHISIHYDSTDNDKGLYYLSVPDSASYRSMEPVASHWQEHHRLGDSLVEGARSAGVKVYGGGPLPTDLTQTSYSTIPSVDVEVGDKGSDYSEQAQRLIAEGLARGIDLFFHR